MIEKYRIFLLSQTQDPFFYPSPFEASKWSVSLVMIWSLMLLYIWPVVVSCPRLVITMVICIGLNAVLKDTRPGYKMSILANIYIKCFFNSNETISSLVFYGPWSWFISVGGLIFRWTDFRQPNCTIISTNHCDFPQNRLTALQKGISIVGFFMRFYLELKFLKVGWKNSTE